MFTSDPGALAVSELPTTFGQTSIVGTPRNVQLRVRLSF
jgi:hypothetical protein